MSTRARQHGALLVLVAGLISLCLAAAFAAALAGDGGRSARERASDRALALAREALVAYAASRPLDALVGPGYLPCPDQDGDGWAEPTCGSQSGHTGQAQRLGHLPWKTLGLPDLRDGHGERLWYAVSSKHKGLLNCGANAACVDMNPDVALGTITVRDALGAVIHDGRSADPRRAARGGAAAVVIAPGAPLERREGAQGEVRRPQSRDSVAARADPANYLDRAPGLEDNADFVDRNDAAGRAANDNGFVAGPVRLPDGSVAVNDRIAVIGYDDLMPRVMQRIAQEIAGCVRARAGAFLVPLCRQSDPEAPLAWTAQPGARFGRVSAEALEACELAPREAAGWWRSWRQHVFVALGVQPVDASLAPQGARREFAVLVAGAPLEGQARAGAAVADAAQWLEAPHGELQRLNLDPAAPECERDPARSPCESGACERVALARAAGRNDVVVVQP